SVSGHAARPPMLSPPAAMPSNMSKFIGRCQMSLDISQKTAESEGKTIPPPSGRDFSNPSPAFDPVTQPQLFDGVIGKRFVAFLIDAVIISLLWFLAVFAVAVLGIVTLG